MTIEGLTHLLYVIICFYSELFSILRCGTAYIKLSGHKETDSLCFWRKNKIDEQLKWNFWMRKCLMHPGKKEHKDNLIVAYLVLSMNNKFYEISEKNKCPNRSKKLVYSST